MTICYFHSASFRIYFGIFCLYLASLQQILKQVQDDGPLRLLWSVHSDLLSPRHSEFISESFLFYSRSLLWILKQVQDDGLLGSVEAFTVGPFRPPQSASFRIYFGIFFLLLSSLLMNPETSSG